jgi:hypothetical protein
VVVQLRRLWRLLGGDLLGLLNGAAALGWAVMPVARKVWQQTRGGLAVNISAGRSGFCSSDRVTGALAPDMMAGSSEETAD